MNTLLVFFSPQLVTPTLLLQRVLHKSNALYLLIRYSSLLIRPNEAIAQRLERIVDNCDIEVQFFLALDIKFSLNVDMW